MNLYSERPRWQTSRLRSRVKQPIKLPFNRTESESGLPGLDHANLAERSRRFPPRWKFQYAPRFSILETATGPC